MALTALGSKPVLAPGRPAALRLSRSRSSKTCRAVAAAVKLDYDTKAFEKELVEFAGAPEYIVKGGRDKFANLPKAFGDIKEVRQRV